jgi:LPS-assembly lipoprotein
VALLALSACGFEPVLAPGGSLDAVWGKVSIAPPNTRADFALRSHLGQRLGGDDGGTYRLTYHVSTSENDAGITPDQVITRRQIKGRASYALADLASGAVLISGDVEGFTSYGTTGTTASTSFARKDAIARLMVILADQIVTQLSISDGIGR